MKYFRWRAYDPDAKEHTGVDEATRFELVVLKLAQQGLSVASIETIEYDEYRKLLVAQRRLNRLKQVRSQFAGEDPVYEIPEKPRRSMLLIVVPLLAACAAILLWYRCFR